MTTLTRGVRVVPRRNGTTASGSRESDPGGGTSRATLGSRRGRSSASGVSGTAGMTAEDRALRGNQCGRRAVGAAEPRRPAEARSQGASDMVVPLSRPLGLGACRRLAVARSCWGRGPPGSRAGAAVNRPLRTGQGGGVATAQPGRDPGLSAPPRTSPCAPLRTRTPLPAGQVATSPVSTAAGSPDAPGGPPGDDAAVAPEAVVVGLTGAGAAGGGSGTGLTGTSGGVPAGSSAGAAAPTVADPTIGTDPWEAAATSARVPSAVARNCLAGGAPDASSAGGGVPPGSSPAGAGDVGRGRSAGVSSGASAGVSAGSGCGSPGRLGVPVLGVPVPGSSGAGVPGSAGLPVPGPTGPGAPGPT